MQQTTQSALAKAARNKLKVQHRCFIFIQQNRTDIGIYLRDDEGLFVIAKTMWIGPVCNVDLGEALETYFVLLTQYS